MIAHSGGCFLFHSSRRHDGHGRAPIALARAAAFDGPRGYHINLSRRQAAQDDAACLRRYAPARPRRAVVQTQTAFRRTLALATGDRRINTCVVARLLTDTIEGAGSGVWPERRADWTRSPRTAASRGCSTPRSGHMPRFCGNASSNAVRASCLPLRGELRGCCSAPWH